jgi:hypothetical protein
MTEEQGLMTMLAIAAGIDPTQVVGVDLDGNENGLKVTFHFADSKVEHKIAAAVWN